MYWSCSIHLFRLAKERAKIRKQEAEGKVQPDPEIVKQLLAMFPLQVIYYEGRRRATNARGESGKFRSVAVGDHEKSNRVGRLLKVDRCGCFVREIEAQTVTPLLTEDTTHSQCNCQVQFLAGIDTSLNDR